MRSEEPKSSYADAGTNVTFCRNQHETSLYGLGTHIEIRIHKHGMKMATRPTMTTDLSDKIACGCLKEFEGLIVISLASLLDIGVLTWA